MLKTTVLAVAIFTTLAAAPMSGANTFIRMEEGASCGMAPSASVKQCSRGHFCEPKAGQCSTKTAAGSCTRVSEVCTMIYQPVCGCDGRTYGNDCERRTRRVGKKHDGAC